MQTHCVNYELVPEDIGDVWREVQLSPGILEFVDITPGGRLVVGQTSHGQIDFRIRGSKTDTHIVGGVPNNFFCAFMGDLAVPVGSTPSRFFFGIAINPTCDLFEYRGGTSNSMAWLSFHYRDVILDPKKRGGVTE